MGNNSMLQEMDFRLKRRQLEEAGVSMEDFIAEEVFKISQRCPVCMKRLDRLERWKGWIVAAVGIGGGAVGAGSKEGVTAFLRILGIL